jgi:signal transduction histidine kinase
MMIHLTEVLDNFFRKKISQVLIVTVFLALIGALILGYLKSKHELNASVEISNSIFSSLLYSKDWDLLNKFSTVLINDHNLNSINIISKENNSTLYQYTNDQFNFIPKICEINSNSDLINLKICKNIISFDFLSYTMLGIILFAIIIYIAFIKSKNEALLFFENISKNLNNILLIDENTKNTFEIKELNDLHQNILKNTLKIKQYASSFAIVEFSRKVAHDLRSPAALIKMATQAEQLNEQDIILIKQAAIRINAISADLLIKSKNDYVYPAKVRMPINTTVLKIINEKKLEYSDQNIIFKFIGLNEEKLLWINQNNFWRVISNILNNAIEAPNDNIKMITVETYIDDSIIIRISDNGHGFPLEVIQDQAQAQYSISKKEGNGLGLFASNEFILSEKGSLKLANNDGATVTISLPNKLIVSNDTPIIQIENDKYVRIAWKASAEKNNYSLHSFNSLKEFLNSASEFSPESEFYIDFNLDDGEKGDEVASVLASKGFNRINLSTGSIDLETTENLKVFNRIIDKNFPYPI